MHSYSKNEWGRVVVANINRNRSIDVRGGSVSEFKFVTHYYTVTVMELPLEGRDTYGVQILKSDTTVLFPQTPKWWAVWYGFLNYKEKEERSIRREIAKERCEGLSDE